MAISAEQRAGLYRAKLRALARDHLGRTDGVDHAAVWGAALETNGAWTALLEADPLASFGQAVVLAVRHKATALDLLAEKDTGALARQAQHFSPAPVVWRIDGSNLHPAEAEPLVELPAVVVPPHIEAVLNEVGVDLVIEHGVATGEVLGVEVARVMTAHDGTQRLDVGVGAYDQGAFATINPDLSDSAALQAVVDQVRAHRYRGAEPHPINRLVRERWLRAELLADPSRVGLSSLRSVEGTVAREGLYDVRPACAVGGGALVACSVGVDLSLVPTAADLAAHHGCDRIIFVLPQRDVYDVTKQLAERLAIPHEFVVADEPWT